MPYRNVTISAILLFFLGVIIWTFSYGPAKRTFVIPRETVKVRSDGEIDSLWHSSGLHGRIAVIFGANLNLQLLGSSYPGGGYLDAAMRHGVVRTAYYIVPDRSWPEVVSENMMGQSLIVPLKSTDNGYILLHEGGRIHLIPLSKYIPGQEKALVVLEKRAWSREEYSRIEGFIKTGQLSTDLMIIINGSGQNLSFAPSARQS